MPDDLTPLRAREKPPLLFQFMDIIREEWTWRRVLYIVLGLVSFYICYVSYRNLKSDLPLVREATPPRVAARLDHFLFFGHNPAECSTLLGRPSPPRCSRRPVRRLPARSSRSRSAPSSSGHRDLTARCLVRDGVSLNWVLGVVSYYSLPTLGPPSYQPSMFADLPETVRPAAGESLLRPRRSFNEDPRATALRHRRLRVAPRLGRVQPPSSCARRQRTVVR